MRLNSVVVRRSPLRTSFSACLVAALVALAPRADAQVETRWVAAGDFHNWYAETGSEIEVGLVNQQQYGWRWPGLNRFGDMQVAKGLWIGAQNVADPDGGAAYPVRVVHVGPRVRGTGEVFPAEFELVTREPLSEVTVDGRSTRSPTPMRPDRVDPSIPSDVLLISRVHTLLGLTMERRIYQFSQPAHDDYHVIEYVLTNTGNTDADDEIELPGQTLEGVIAYLQYRLAVVAETRYVIGNPTGWGKNTMNDARGDGTQEDPDDEQFRAQFSWHGYFPAREVSYDNLGGSIQRVTENVFPGDDYGRLGAHAFAGVVTLHADASAADDSDDPDQPTTTNWYDSDGPLFGYHFDGASNVERMTAEYALMSEGHRSPRHALSVEPTGLPGFLNPSRDPSAAEGAPNSGGFSFANGFGPYTLAPGESVRFVVAEGASGLSRAAASSIGRQFKDSGNDTSAGLTYGGETMTKNEWVFTSRDSLFQTFRRALANYDAGFAIPRAPAPPTSFSVSGEAGVVRLAWTASPGAAAYEVYRTAGRYDSTSALVHRAEAGDLGFDDADVEVGVPYFYHVVAVGSSEANDGAGMTPPGALRSTPYATQTYRPVYVLPVATEAGPDVAALRVSAPSPHPVRDRGRFEIELESPSAVTATVYSVTGRQVAQLLTERPLAGGRHEVAWDASGVAPGVYVLRVRTATATGAVRVVVAR